MHLHIFDLPAQCVVGKVKPGSTPLPDDPAFVFFLYQSSGHIEKGAPKLKLLCIVQWP